MAGGTVCMSCSIPSSPEWWGLGRDLAPGRCEDDLWFFHFSVKIKARLVCCCLIFNFFYPPSILDFNHSSPPQPKLSASVNKCERNCVSGARVAKLDPGHLRWVLA